MPLADRTQPSSSSHSNRQAMDPNNAIPRISLNLWEHKGGIAITWTVLFTSSCVLPILLYFLLQDVAHLKESIVLGVPTGIFGAASLLSYFQRLWSLARRDSTTRPVGGGRRGLDYFHHNFTLGFCYVTALIAYSTASKPAHTRVVALPLSLLMLQVCAQIVVGWVMGRVGLRYPFRFSSMRKGERVRPAIYTIIEDVVAVDGKQGTAYRVELNQAYERRSAVRTILERLDLLWGFSGLCVGAMDIGLIFGLDNVDVAWCVGWAVPWAWAAICTVLSIIETRALLKMENAAIRDGRETAKGDVESKYAEA